MLIPTKVGTLAGVVAEPDDRSRAAVVLLPGAGGPGRAGANAFWARLARKLAEQGLITLRFDYPHRGNGSSAVSPDIDLGALENVAEDADILAARDATAWFRGLQPHRDLFLAGECIGARLAYELLPYDDDVAGVFAVAPYLREAFVPLAVREAPAGPDEAGVQILDERLLAALRELLGRGRPAWVLIGGLEGEDPFMLQRRLGEAGDRLEIEVVPGLCMHPVVAADVQAEAGARLSRRIGRELASPARSATPPLCIAALPPGPDIPPARQAAGLAMRQLSFLQELRDRYGDIFSLRLPGEKPQVVVADPDLVKQIFSAPEATLNAGEGNRAMSPVFGPLLGEYSLFLLDGKRHLGHRRLLLPPLHGERLESQAQTMRAIAEEHLGNWAVGEELEALPLIQELVLDVAMHAVFGASPERWSESMRDAMLALRLPMSARDSTGDEYCRLVRRGEALTDEAMAERRGDPHPGQREDVLSLLLEARTEDGSHLSDLEIRDELLTLVMAGTETTATALAWALERLARNPEALARAVEDAREGAPYIDAVIYETLRMRPVVPVATRLVKQPFAIGGYVLPPGVKVSTNAFLIHHRADIYREPTRFHPERFLAMKPGTYTWIPFGGGVRRCIGASFALMEMRIVLASLLARMTPRALDSEAEAMRNRNVITLPSRRATIMLEPRAGAASGLR